MNSNSIEKSKNPMPLQLGLVLIGYSSLMANGYIDNLKGPVLSPMMSELKLNHDAAMWFFVVASITAFTGGFFCAKLIHFTSRRTAMILGWCFGLIGSLGFLLASSYPLVLLFSAIQGTGIGICGVLQNLLVSEGSPTERRRKTLSGLHAMYAVAGFVAPVATGVLMLKLHWSWLSVMATGAVLPIILLFNSKWLRGRDHHEHLGSQSIGFKKVDLKDESVSTSLTTSLAHKAQIVLACSMAAYVAAEVLLSTRLAIFVERAFEHSPATANLYLSGFFVGLLAGRTLYTFVSPPLSVNRQIVFGLLGSLFTWSLGLLVHPFFLSLTGFAMAPLYALNVMRGSERFYSHLPRFLSYAQSFSSLSVIAINFVFGGIADHIGLKASMWLGPLCLGLAMLLFLRSEGRLQLKAQSAPLT